MLSRLSIQNYAIIDKLDVDFSSQLNIITGETGAGKSIIVGALGLILGQRAESNVLLNKERKCIVEGCFKGESSDDHISGFLKENELDALDELVVRREISPGGKSRAFINDTPVNLSQLNQLSSLLVDLHQQFDTLELGESDFQREVLDALASNFNAENAKQILGTVTAFAVELEQIIAAAGVGGGFNALQVEQLTALFGNLAGVVIQAVHDASGQQLTPESVLALMPSTTTLQPPVE